MKKSGKCSPSGRYGAFISTESQDYKDLLRDVEEKHIGSFAIQTQGSPLGIVRSQVYPTAVLVNTLQSHAKVPLLVAADFERGTSMRVEEGSSFPHAMAVAATGRPEDAYTMGKITALEARAIGVPWIFAPDADVNSNPENPIINTRSFGEDPARVSEFVAAFVRGVEENGGLGDRKAFSRPWRYQHGFTSRSPDRNRRSRASGSRGTRTVSRGDRRRREHDHDRPPGGSRAGARSRTFLRRCRRESRRICCAGKWVSTEWW